MVNENLIKNLIENKKPVELVQELKDEYKIPSFEEFMKTYESNENLNYEDLENSSVGKVKGYGSMYRASSGGYTTNFSIIYRFDHSESNLKNYFEQYGNYSSVWSMSGSWDDLYKEQHKFETGIIRVVRNAEGVMRRTQQKMRR